jgi:anaerobic ribonucleoside-triphosphate reductase activating protein
MLIHGFVGPSRVNGPGLRTVVFFQGCTLGCAGCWNPDTHEFRGVEQNAVEVTERVIAVHRVNALEGVTFSGGEPMQQAPALWELIRTLRQAIPNLSFGMYSGYSWRQLKAGRYWTLSELPSRAKQDLWADLKSELDFAVLGRYVAIRPAALPLRTSANQELHLLTRRYVEEDFNALEIEVHVSVEGLVQVTGFPVAGLPI